MSMSSSVGPSYFYEDEVFRIGKNGEVEFGMVTENWDMYSSDEEEEEDQLSHQSKVPHGSVAVTWFPKSKDQVLQESKVLLSDRSLMPGDVVRRHIAGKDTQRGYCRSVKVSADVQILGSRKVIMGVPATSLIPVQKLQSEIAVYLDSWIGVVRDVKYLLTLKFFDGSSCVIDSFNLLDKFEDLRKNCDAASSEIFYPGQKLRGRMRHLKDADYSSISDELKRSKDRKVVTVVVTDVQPASISVQWQWQTCQWGGAATGAGGEKKDTEKDKDMEVNVNDKDKGKDGEEQDKEKEKEKNKDNPPAETISGDDLKRVKCLNLFESCTVQLSDISFYPPSPKDPLIEKAQWKERVLALALAQKEVQSQSSEPKKGENEKEKGQGQEKVDLEMDMDVDVEGRKTEGEGQQGQGKSAQQNENEEGAESDENAEESNNKKVKETSKLDGKKQVPKVCTRSLRKKKLKKAVRQQPVPKLEPEAPTVVETLHTQSVVDVVWQDGTYEEGMRSIDLYPIHHLDDHEFFPGDFVVTADSSDFKTYGVIQHMDHCGRVAMVKWFEAYSFSGVQRPTELEESLMSVYDIKDHPDFRFRPGTIVIRVANVQENQCPAGQILDNYPDGQVRVWWADGAVTPCWPQDLFRLGDYDSDDEAWDDEVEGEAEAEAARAGRRGQSDGDIDSDGDGDGVNSDSSWETETEDDHDEEKEGEGVGERYQNIGTLIERIQKTLVSTREAIVASSNVSVSVTTTGSEEMLGSSAGGAISSPGPVAVAKLGGFDERGLTKKLLLIYKDCQYLDKIMGTKYFEVEDLKKWHKDNEESCSSSGPGSGTNITSQSLKSRRMMEQISRLFDVPQSQEPQSPATPTSGTPSKASISLQQQQPNTPSRSESSEEFPFAYAYASNPGMLLYELCSIILKKLLEAHKEYEKKFGGHKALLALELEEKLEKPHVPKPVEVELPDGMSLETFNRYVKEKNGIKQLTASMVADLLPQDLTKTHLSMPESVLHMLLSPEEISQLKKEIQEKESKHKDKETKIEIMENENEVEPIPVLEKSSPSSSTAIPGDSLSTMLTSTSTSTWNNFHVIDSIPDTHRYRLTSFLPGNQRTFVKTVQRELGLLRESLPEGIYVKGFEDRMDLYSVMIKGPEKTPYEDGLFLFDINLPSAYPSVPPMVHYIAFCTDRLNPNLYEEGKVCVSLLGTWNGKGTEVWTNSSSLLQLLVSIQGLILVPEPYYNEAGYEKQRGTQQGAENSRMYNENVLIKLVQSMSRMIANPPAPFQKEVIQHIKTHGPRLLERYTNWLSLSDNGTTTATQEHGAKELKGVEVEIEPSFSLLPVSKGFQITLAKTLASFKQVLTSI